jgi:hypothetical protein
MVDKSECIDFAANLMAFPLLFCLTLCSQLCPSLVLSRLFRNLGSVPPRVLSRLRCPGGVSWPVVVICLGAYLGEAIVASFEDLSFGAISGKPHVCC